MADSSDEVGRTVVTDEDSRVGMPRWVKTSLIVVAGLVLLLVLAKVTGLGGDHGPGRHGGGGDSKEVVDDDGGHRSPIDHGR